MADGPKQLSDDTSADRSDTRGLSTRRRAAGGDGDMVDRAEELAERAMSAFADKLELPSVRDEASRAIGFLASIDSWSLRFVVATVLSGSIAGFSIVLVGIEPVGALPDWHMHGAMYIAVISFLMLYIKAHRGGRLFGSFMFAFLSAALCVFFAWILFDRIPERTLIFVEDDVPRAALRPTFRALAVPAWLLLCGAAGLCFHVLVPGRKKRADSVPDPHAAD